MAARATVTYTAEISDLRKQLASIPDITAAEARKAVSNLNKAVKGVERAQKKAATAAKAMATGTRSAAKGARGMGAALQSTAQQVPDVISQLSSGTSVLQTFTQQGLQVAQVAMVRMGGASGPLTIGLAAVSSAVAVGYTAWRIWNDEAEHAERVAEHVRAAEEARIPILDALRQSTIDLAVATGEMTAEAAKLDRISLQAWKRYQDGTEESRKKIVELRKEQRSWGTAAVELAQAYAPAWTPVGAAVRALTDDEADLQQEIAALNVEVTKSIDLTAAQSERAREATTITDGRAEATRRMAEADREAARAAQEARKLERESLKALREEEQERAKEIAEADRVYLAGKREAVAMMAAEEQAAIDLATAQRASLDSVLSSSQDLAAGLSSAFADGSAAARAFYAVSQAIAASGAVISGLQASVAALLPPPIGLGPVMGAPLALAMSAFGYAQAGVIAAQTVASFADTPGPVRAGGHGMAATFAPGDTVIAGRDTRDIQRQLDGAGGSSGPVVVERDVYRHLGRYGARDALRAPRAYEQVRRQARRTPGRR